MHSFRVISFAYVTFTRKLLAREPSLNRCCFRPLTVVSGRGLQFSSDSKEKHLKFRVLKEFQSYLKYLPDGLIKSATILVMKAQTLLVCKELIV